ncbi:MAG: HlyD family efflux transporter periplasmic adaptor subunit [Bacteroidetes bacterium]|nr:HlyD family efflux transporter periplasmic adaptor subunit [Bacteroidota bacterium]
MNKNYIYIFCISVVLSACGGSQKIEEQPLIPKSPVQVTTIRIGSIDDNLTLSATSIYLKRNVITSEIPAFITKVNIHLGDKVLKGQVLYELQTKERKALGKQVISADTALANFGNIKIYSPASGIISTFDKQQTGDYVLEGTQLCTIAESNDLAFQINVPYEFIQFTKVGDPCMITLPDNSTHKATITTPLTAMNTLAQTQTILAKCHEVLFLPENLIVKVLVTKPSSINKQVIAKQCVLSDEMMQEFWVMKLMNDSTAVRVPVVIGNKNDKEVEINSPQFGVNDRIITNGNYGLADTAFVKITK